MSVAFVAAAAAPTAADKPPLPATQPPAASPPRFAELLRQSRAGAAVAPAPAVTPSSTAPPESGEAVESADESSESQDAAVLASRAAPANAAKARAATPKGATGKAVVESASTAAEPAREAAAAEASSRADVVGLGLLPTDRSVDTRALPASSSEATRAGLDAAETEPAQAQAGDARIGERRKATGVETARDGTARAAEAPAFAAALAGAAQGSESALPATPSQPPVIDAMAAANAAAAATRALDAAPIASAPTELAMPTPVHAPEFAAALGVQVSVLAKDGVQHAELHLNPADMGPVSIRIALDGTAARVDFGADLAATRQAIEQGLPELASALREAGFTLAGGGVSQHAGTRAGEGGERGHGGAQGVPGDDDRPSGPVGSDLVPAPARVARRVALGGIDLYA